MVFYLLFRDFILLTHIKLNEKVFLEFSEKNANTVRQIEVITPYFNFLFV